MNAQRSLFHDSAPTLDEIMSVFDFPVANWLSRKEIADKLGRSKSPTLIAHLSVAVKLGYLLEAKQKLPNGADYFLYSPSQKWTQVEDEMPF